MERLKARQSLGHKSKSSKADYPSNASFGFCLLHLLEISSIFLFSEMGAPVVAFLAIQTSVFGVKGKQGHKEHSLLCMQGQFCLFDVSKKLL